MESGNRSNSMEITLKRIRDWLLEVRAWASMVVLCVMLYNWASSRDFIKNIAMIPEVDRKVSVLVHHDSTYSEALANTLLRTDTMLPHTANFRYLVRAVDSDRQRLSAVDRLPYVPVSLRDNKFSRIQ